MAELTQNRRHTLYDRRHTAMVEPLGRTSPSIAGASIYFRRISWPAVWGGAFIAMGIQLMLGLVAPRASLLGGQIPLVGISLRTGLWYLIYTLLAFYIGGWAASALAASNLTDIERRLHGLVMWAVANLFVFLILGMTPVSGSLPSGWALSSGGWMFGGMLIGLLAALFGAKTVGNPESLE
jgi:hypothetical protein